MKRKTVEFALTRKLLTYAEIDLPGNIDENDIEAIKQYINQNWDKVEHKNAKFRLLNSSEFIDGSEEIFENRQFNMYEWYDDLFSDILDDDEDLESAKCS